MTFFNEEFSLNDLSMATIVLSIGNLKISPTRRKKLENLTTLSFTTFSWFFSDVELNPGLLTENQSLEGPPFLKKEIHTLLLSGLQWRNSDSQNYQTALLLILVLLMMLMFFF